MTRGTLRGYLELGRVSNLPTVWTNVLLGAAIGIGSGDWVWSRVGAAAAAASLLYVAGMALNDVVDVDRDRVERPGRPIPSGRIPWRNAVLMACACFVAALSTCAVLGRDVFLLGSGLALAVAAYDALHRRLVEAAVLMGICRGLVYLVAAVAVADADGDLPWVRLCGFAAAMAIYIGLLTVLARREAASERPPRRWILGGAALLPTVAIAPIVIGAVTDRVITPQTAGLALLVVVWLVAARRHLTVVPARPVSAVMAWLAGICLIDASWLMALEHQTAALAALVAFVMTVGSHRFIEGS